MKSMTGFGHRDFQDEESQIQVELKSYNNRYLDININLPSALGVLEPRFRQFLADRVQRGKVELAVRYRRLLEELSFSVDKHAVTSFVDVLKDICNAAGISDEISLSHVLKMEELVKARRDVDPEAVWAVIEPLLEEASSDFEASRIREGSGTKSSILTQLSVIKQAVEEFEKRAGNLEAGIREGIVEKFHQVLGNRVDEDRVLAETAVLLVKFSIDEEIQRLNGHLEAFAQTVELSGPVGKKLDFLCQELNRELNTVGSKSTVLEINRLVVDAKDALEKIREQLRNVE